ncbi:MAG: maleylacetoacetate isomerase [Parvularculaceae bacterium]|nr:maleylacetoacetate isomerase [Parvularculaceae bacterium]
MRLYGYWRSSATYRVRIALALKKLAYEYSAINLLKNEQQSPDYLLISPQGLVPTLIDANGARLNQSLAIIEYLEEAYPDPPLLPVSPTGRARARAIAAAIACEAQPFGNLRIMNYLKDEAGLADEARRAFLNRWVGGALKAVDRMARETAGRFCVGDAPTLADVFVVPQLATARRFSVDIDECATLLAIEENCARLEAFQRARPENQPDAVKS